MNSIQQVGFTHAVIAANTHDMLFKLESLQGVVFELGEWYGMKIQQNRMQYKGNVIANWNLAEF